MDNKKFEIFVEDVGDESVGIRPVVTLKAELAEDMVDYLVEERILGDFEAKLEALVSEFFDAEIYYRTYDTRDLDAEREYYEQRTKEECK